MPLKETIDKYKTYNGNIKLIMNENDRELDTSLREPILETDKTYRSLKTRLGQWRPWKRTSRKGSDRGGRKTKKKKKSRKKKSYKRKEKKRKNKKYQNVSTIKE